MSHLAAKPKEGDSVLSTESSSAKKRGPGRPKGSKNIKSSQPATADVIGQGGSATMVADQEDTISTSSIARGGTAEPSDIPLPVQVTEQVTEQVPVQVPAQVAVQTRASVHEAVPAPLTTRDLNEYRQHFEELNENEILNVDTLTFGEYIFDINTGRFTKGRGGCHSTTKTLHRRQKATKTLLHFYDKKVPWHWV